MPALPTVVSTYIENIVSSLQRGSDLGQNIRAAGQNYLRAQDIATILELLQEATKKTSLAATAGSTTTATVTSIPADTYVGALVTFDDDTTTAALQGVTTRVLSHTTTVFTFEDTLPAAVASTDSFTVEHDFMNGMISTLREGKGIAAATPGNPYALDRTVMDAFAKFLDVVGGNSMPSYTVSRSGAKVASGSTTTVVNTNDTYRIDELKGLSFTVSGESRKIVGNTENAVTLSYALTSAPSADTAFTVSRVLTETNPTRKNHVYAGGQPDNAHLANLIDVTKTVVTDLTLPT